MNSPSTSDADLTLDEAVKDLRGAYESMLNSSTYQNATNTNLILNLAPIVEHIRNILMEIDTD